MRVTVYVSQENIDEGRRASCEACPIALAIKRALPGCKAHVFGNDATLYFPGNRNGKSVQLPGSARQFVERFDNDLSVAPFTFTVGVAQ